MSKSQGSELADFSKAAMERVNVLTAEFRGKLSDAACELLEHMPNTNSVSAEVVELALAKVCAEWVSEFQRRAGEGVRRHGERDAA